MTVFEELRRRGLIAQATHEDQIEELLNKEPVTFYIGFDATADSLHVGHFLQLVVMKHMQNAGHRPIALLGTGTTMIGDPTGKTDMRKMLTVEEIDHNAECFRKQMSRFIDFSEGKAIIARNGDWLKNMNYIEFLRDVGVHFSVNKMLTAECVKSRLERGLTFLEFNYMLMQSYDFLHLNREYGCKLELGGDDQWSNIHRRRRSCPARAGGAGFRYDVHASDHNRGQEDGQDREGRACGLIRTKPRPMIFISTGAMSQDDDVINCMKLITFVPIEEIEEMEHLEGHELNPVKERLAYEVTSMVHGEEEAKKAQAAAKSLFVKGSDDANMPSTTLTEQDLTNDEIGVLTLLVKTRLAPSNAEARRLVQGGGVSIDDKKVDDPKQTISADTLRTGIIIKKGKKIFHKATLA